MRNPFRYRWRVVADEDGIELAGRSRFWSEREARSYARHMTIRASVGWTEAKARLMGEPPVFVAERLP